MPGLIPRSGRTPKACPPTCPVRSYASFTDWLRAVADAEIPAWKQHVATVREEINADGSITLHW